jgi:hypothetical protein
MEHTNGTGVVKSDKPKPQRKRAGRKPITVQQFAAKHKVGERKLRRHLRSLGMGVGRGERYTLKAADQTKLLKSIKG